MDTRLLEYYNRELAYLRELGAEFATRYPKAAGRLGMQGIEVADPYVERLLEGFSFLTARVQLKMDAEFPRFTQRLLSMVYPAYLAPRPATGIVQLQASTNEGSLAGGFTLPAGTALRARLARGEQTACEFRTAHALTLWPLSIEQARIGAVPHDLPAAGPLRRARAVLRIGVQIGAGQRCETLQLDQLMLHLAAPEARALRLLELVMGQGLAVVCRDASGRCSPPLPAGALRHEGFAAEQALLPHDGRSFQGYRLLQEYFALPARFLFFSVNGLKQALRSLQGDRFEVMILLGEDDPALERSVVAGDFALNCSPVINLFPRRTDRVLLTQRRHEYQVVVDRTRPLDYEVHSIARVVGHGAGDLSEREFRPFYASNGSDVAEHGAYYALRREPRLLSERAQHSGHRSGYVGSEVFISLVDRDEAPYDPGLRHLSIDALCTNRDLSLLLPLEGEQHFSLAVSAPVSSVRLLRAPTRPQAPMGDDAQAWRLISHLGLNFQGLSELDGERAAAVLRQLLGLYLDQHEGGLQRQVEGVRRLEFAPAFRRLPMAGPAVFGRGVQIRLTVDEHASAGDSPYLFGAVLEQFFARHVAINSFAELSLHSLQRGERAKWASRLGARPLL